MKPTASLVALRKRLEKMREEDLERTAIFIADYGGTPEEVAESVEHQRQVWVEFIAAAERTNDLIDNKSSVISSALH